MKVVFAETDRKKILQNIKDAMGHRTLAELVDFSLSGDSLKITISKLGTSIIEFAESAADGGITYTLRKEKIALTHKAFKDEVTGKILQVIEKAGGKVSK